MLLSTPHQLSLRDVFTGCVADPTRFAANGTVGGWFSLRAHGLRWLQMRADYLSAPLSGIKFAWESHPSEITGYIP